MGKEFSKNNPLDKLSGITKNNERMLMKNIIMKVKTKLRKNQEDQKQRQRKRKQ